MCEGTDWSPCRNTTIYHSMRSDLLCVGHRPKWRTHIVCPHLFPNATCAVSEAPSRLQTRSKARCLCDLHVNGQTTDGFPVGFRQCDLCAARSFEGPGIHVEVSLEGGVYAVDVTATRARPMVLHWAVNGWEPPPEGARPEGTVQVAFTAVIIRTLCKSCSWIKAVFIPETKMRSDILIIGNSALFIMRQAGNDSHGSHIARSFLGLL